MTFEQETDLLCVYLYDLIRENIAADGHLLSSSDSDKLQSCAERLSAQAALIKQYEEEMRALASWLGAGGYNATDVTPKVLAEKIRWGVDHIVRVESNRRDSVIEQQEKEIERLRKAMEEIEKLSEHNCGVIALINTIAHTALKRSE